jgi:ferredoxin-thioredoxin reductase catalytic subunit
LKRNKAQSAKAMVLFAKKNSFIFNPALGYDYFLKNYVKYGECSCATERKYCPCPEAAKEVNKLGKCKCGLYWKDLDCWLRWDPTNPSKNIIHEPEEHGSSSSN